MKTKKTLNGKDKRKTNELNAWREKYKDFIIKDQPLISIPECYSYLRRKRLARLILIVLAYIEKGFLSDIYENVSKIFKIKSYSMDYLRCLNELSIYNLIEIHNLGLSKDEEMNKRYKLKNIKYPISKIHYYKFKNCERNMQILNWCSESEFKRK